MIHPPSDAWSSLLRHTPLGILTDLHGTVLPFASTLDAARPTPALRQLLDDLATLPGVTLFVVSARAPATLDELFPPPRAVRLVAEHGAWRSGDGWESMLSIDASAVDSLVANLRDLLARYPEALLERKTWSVAIHFRMVPAHRHKEMLVQAAAITRPWLESHPEFERLSGSELVEIRPRLARKGSAVAWARELLGAEARLLVVGDDVTDEDMFAAARPDDASVLVGSQPGHATQARWRLGSPDDACAFYRAIVALRRDGTPIPPSLLPVGIAPHEATTPSPYRLLVLSNRLPELRSVEASPHARKQNVGGLVSALQPVLARYNGIWLGWSGRTHAAPTPTEPVVDVVQGLALAWVDFPEEWQRRYYNGVSNSALWPLMHSFPGRVSFSHADWKSYVSANEAFASVATKLVGPDETIWVHDYHLLLLASGLRVRGHRGPVGLFQHIPFPGPDIFFLLPWAADVLEAMLDFDVVGFHTQSYVDNFLRCMACVPGARVEGDRVVRGERTVTARAFPIGIIPEDFQEAADEAVSDEIVRLTRAIHQSRIVLGVDRLDYTKGIPERIDAFGKLLELFPEWRRNVCLVQVSVPSRADIPEYAEQRTRVENSVGRINGEFGEADWVPIRYLYRSYGRSHLSQLYRAADVGYVTPLRDGMNLVAKEYVAAQNPDEPGVLLLSRFAGAAEELRHALLTNPWDSEGTARDLDLALRMPLAERKARHGALLEVISRTTALTWAEDFLSALEATRATRKRDSPVATTPQRRADM